MTMLICDHEYVCICFLISERQKMGSTMGDDEDNEFTPFQPFTRDSLFLIERRIAEEKTKVIQ